MKDFKPPLPEPFIQYEGCAPMFTEAQLLAYRAEVIELCAKECEQIDSRYAEEDQDIHLGVQWCAEEIRSLK